jgi:hypothetical protein
MTDAEKIAAAVSAMADKRDAAWCARYGVTAEIATMQAIALQEAAQMILHEYADKPEASEPTQEEAAEMAAGEIRSVMTPKRKPGRPRKS